MLKYIIKAKKKKKKKAIYTANYIQIAVQMVFNVY